MFARFLMLVALSVLSTGAAAQESGPSVTWTTTISHRYVVNPCIRLTDTPVWKNDLWVQWPNGLYFDFWSATSLETPGTEAKDGPGNEIDPFAVGKRFAAGKFGITPELAYYMFVPMDDFGNDMVQLRLKIDRPIVRDKWTLAPYIDLKAFEPTTSDGYAGGQLYMLGLAASRPRLRVDSCLVYDDGVGGGHGIILRLTPTVSLWERGGTSLAVGVDLFQPLVGAENRDFEWAGSVAWRVKLR